MAKRSAEMNGAVLVGGEPPNNSGGRAIEFAIPYVAKVELTGDCDLLLHRWNCDAVEEKAKANKNSAAKKTDNLESYIYRMPNGNIGLPGTYLRGALITAAKSYPDPRSPRKSAQDLVKAALVPLTDLADLGIRNWTYEHRCRVTIQRAGITRVRPAIRDWKARFEVLVQVPEYVDSVFLRRLLADAGRLVGIGDFRPTYGRFSLTGFEVL